MSRNLPIAFLLALVSGVAGAGATPPTVHVAWSESPAPQTPDDYEVVNSDLDFPDVVLKAGSLTWRIGSTDADNPNNIGDIGTISSPHPQNFAVKIEGDSGAPGARIVKGIILDPQGTGSDANYSRLIGGAIATMDGDLMLQKSSSGTGGDITSNVTISSAVLGNISIHAIRDATLTAANLEGDITITGEIENGYLFVYGPISNTTTIDIAGMSSTSAVQFQEMGESEFAGTLLLHSGIGASQTVSIGGPLASTATIDLYDQDVGGLFQFAGGSGRVINGGAVTGSAHINLVKTGTVPFSGSVEFLSVESGTIETEFGNVDGHIKVKGNMEGQIYLRYCILGDDSLIEIGGDLTGQIVNSAVEGERGDLLGRITVEGDVSGAIQIEGEMSGDIDIEGSLTGSISVWETLRSSGRILIDELCNGPVTIGQETESLSLIRAKAGLGSNGSIRINDSRGDYDARGVIHLGTTASIIPTPPPGVAFDGSIKILRNSGNTDGGDLIGGITVIGCHATSAALDICICGTNSGHVSITQTQCSNQVSWSCVSGCN